MSWTSYALLERSFLVCSILLCDMLSETVYQFLRAKQFLQLLPLQFIHAIVFIHLIRHTKAIRRLNVFIFKSTPTKYSIFTAKQSMQFYARYFHLMLRDYNEWECRGSWIKRSRWINWFVYDKCRQNCTDCQNGYFVCVCEPSTSSISSRWEWKIAKEKLFDSGFEWVVSVAALVD